jgi:hypothetical protein
MTQQGLDDAAAPSGGLFLFELIDEIDEIEEAAARSGADDRGGGGDRQVGLSRTVPPIRMRLRLASMKSPAASSRICPSSTGEPSKMKASRSFSTGNLAPLMR